ncbi:MAG TPA: L,D-transpeptidase family protein [Allosphingosinicella sp.]|nr:L,D-transpeptidase family protein [Allosphingosinicella sp.]
MRAGTKAAAAAMLALAGCNGMSGGNESGSAPVAVAAADLQAAVNDPRVRRFYEARQWRPVWGEEQERALVAAVSDARRHGLDSRRYLRGLEGAAPAAREAALTLAAISYGEALARGQTDPERVNEIYEIPRPEADVVGGLAAAVEQGNVGEWLAGLAPQDEEYRALSEAYIRWSEAAAREQAPAIRTGDAIHVGDSDPRVPAIVAALRTHGYLPAETPPAPQQTEGKAQAPQRPAAAPTRYTEEVAAAVRRVQEDYGINADGVIGSGTLDILNATARDRARQLAVNLERRRWLPRTAPTTRIDVNTAAAFLEYWRDGQLVDSRVVVVGQPDWETPALQSPIVRLVANPPWSVPRSIEEEELLPKGEAYLARNNFTRRNGRLVQEPGPESALGLVKLDMGNRHAIYLHDTPSKAGFARAERHLSHGCVRVRDAVGFATLIADHDGKRAQFERALARRNDEGEPQEGAVQLERPLPVRLLYHSVYRERSGRLLFRPDAYGWDENVAEALGLPPRQRPPTVRHTGDIGP